MKTSALFVLLTAVTGFNVAQAACPKVPEVSQSSVVGRIGKSAITLKEVDALIEARLCSARMTMAEQQATLRAEALSNLIDERLLEAEAKKRGLASRGALIEALGKTAPTPNEAQARDFFEKNRQQIGDQPFEGVRDRIVEVLVSQAQTEVVSKLVATLRAANGVKVELPVFRFPVEAIGPSRGPAGAPVTIVVFADFECPYCSKGATALEQVRQRHPKEVRVVYRDYPLPFHQNAVPAAVAARCSGEQGKYWEMHDALYTESQGLSDALYTRVATGLKLDGARFTKCMNDPKQRAAVQADMKAGSAAGVDGTPAFFVNGIKLTGAQPPEAFEKVIAEELSRGPARR